MSVRKASKREIQKDERRAVAPVVKPKPKETSKKGTLITKSEPPGPTMFPVAKSKKSKTGNHKKFSKSGFLI